MSVHLSWKYSHFCYCHRGISFRHWKCVWANDSRIDKLSSAIASQIMNTFIANGACSDDETMSNIWSFLPENMDPVVPNSPGSIRGLASGQGDLLAFMANLTQALSDLGIVLGELNLSVLSVPNGVCFIKWISLDLSIAAGSQHHRGISSAESYHSKTFIACHKVLELHPRVIANWHWASSL